MIASWLLGLAVVTTLASVTWLISVLKRDVSIVDSIWSLMLLAAGVTYALDAGLIDSRGSLVLALLAAWGVRLSLHVTLRNWGEPEDRRYREIRARYAPGFAWKSLFIIFLFQAMVAAIIALPLLWIMLRPAPLGPLDLLATLLWLVGMGFEIIADYQLSRFSADPANRGRVLRSGLWRYSRHPNYFGECCIWWAFFLFALAAGGWWTIVSPLLMTWLLLKFSGVGHMETGIEQRRPEYRDYIATTNAFVPGPPRTRPERSHGGDHA